jgi:hypothetical protein
LGSQLELLMASGGGPDIWPDPISQRTPLGTSARPAPTEIWFGSTGHSSVGMRGYRAALETLGQLIATDATILSPTRWLDNLRARIAQSIAGTPDCAVIFTPGVQEARDLARAIAATVTRRPMQEIAAAAAESTAFVPAQEADFLTAEISMRDQNGDRRSVAEIDADARSIAAEALCDGAGVLLHVLDTSKTGLLGPSRRIAAGLATISPGRVCVVVDASELRCTAQTIARDLANGRMVLVSGSHFAGGPPACAALLLPRTLANELAAGSPILAPPGIARFDVPGELRPVMVLDGSGSINLGLGLRWTAALAEYDAYLAIPEDIRVATLATFARKARYLAALCSGIDPEARPLDDADDALRENIVPLILDEPRSTANAMAQAEGLHQGLLAPSGLSVGDAVCHIGAPIPFGSHAALPISASAALVADVGERVARGLSFDTAFGPVKRDLGTLFDKLDTLQALA